MLFFSILIFMMNKQTRYNIKVGGHLDHGWQAWFEGFCMTKTADGGTVLSGVVCDQAALYGVLKKILNLGLTLISINPEGCDLLDDGTADDKQAFQDQTRPCRVDQNE